VRGVEQCERPQHLPVVDRKELTLVGLGLPSVQVLSRIRDISNETVLTQRD
jgi:hypothetical protein